MAEKGAPATASPPFAGRQLELTRLSAESRRAQAGTRLTLVRGETGIGKSWLVSEFAARLESPGPVVLFGYCEREGQIPYQPVVDALRGLLASEEGHADLAYLGPEWFELQRLLPGDENVAERSGSAPISFESQRHRLFEGVLTLLANVSRVRPLLFILEDLHWSDQHLLGLLRHLLRNRRLRRVHVVATYRESDLDADHPLHGFLADVGHDDACTSISLEGLSEPDVAELLGTDSSDLDPIDRTRYLNYVFERTDGNPFLVLEMFRHLREKGSGGSPDGISGLPWGVRQLMAVRMRSLPVAVRDVLGAASVLGHHFDFTLLQRILAIPASELLDLLGAAGRAGHITQADGRSGEFRFAHAIVRDAVYAILSPGERSSIHHRAGLALESLWRTAHAPEQLAHHFQYSAEPGGAELAVRYCRIAGERALRALDFEEAVTYFESALRAHERAASATPLERCELLLQLGRAQGGVAWPQAAAVPTQQRAIVSPSHVPVVADDIGSAALLAHPTAESVGPGLEGSGSYGASKLGPLQLREDALQLLPLGPGPERPKTLLGLRGLHTAAGPGLPGRGQEIHGFAQLPGVLERGTSSELAAGIGFWETGSYRDAVTTFDRCIATAQDRPDVLCAALFLRLACVCRLGQIGEMQRTARDMRDYAQRLGDPILRVWAERLYAGGLAHRSGDVELARRHNQKAAEAATEIGSRHIVLYAESQRLYIETFGANWVRLRGTWESWLRSGSPAQLATVAWSSAHAGDFAITNAQLDAFEAANLAIARDRFRVNALSHAAEAAALAGRVTLAARLYDELLPAEGLMFDCGTPAFVVGPVGRPLGMLASLLQRWDAADAHFDAAIRAAENMNHRPAVADTTFEHARSLLARNHWGERTRAREMAEFAEDEAKAMGYTLLAADAAQMLDSMVRGTHPAGLSDREVAVLRLVSRGLSNKAIARELVLSPSTVATHLRHIFDKTNSTNRAQAVAFAVRHDLT